MRKLFFTIGMFVALPAMAAQIGFVSNADHTSLDLVINANDPINAIKGTIEVGSTTAISTGGSLVPVWLVNPMISGGKLQFEGVIPGGVQGSGKILSLSSKDGPIDARISEFEAYLNDGLGTKDKVTLLPDKISALETITKDQTPPESFSPEITSNPDIFDGRYFLTFSTTDKQSGINHYEVKEGNGSWVRADSPYLIANQDTKGDISVKAVDRSGNFIVIKANQTNLPNTAHNIYVVGAYILLSLMILVALAYLWSKKRTYRY